MCQKKNFDYPQCASQKTAFFKDLFVGFYFHENRPKKTKKLNEKQTDGPSSSGAATRCDGLLVFPTSFLCLFLSSCVCVCASACVQALPRAPPNLPGLEIKHPNCLECKIAALFSVRLTCADAFLIPGPNTSYRPHFKAKSPPISLFPAGYKTRFNPYPVYVTERNVSGKEKKNVRDFSQSVFFFFFYLEGRIPKGAQGRERSTLSPLSSRAANGQPSIASDCQVCSRLRFPARLAAFFF